jgi:hypothetical protein
MPFVSYLNWVFRNGGFPWPTASDSQWRVKQALAKDLIPSDTLIWQRTTPQPRHAIGV